MLRVTEKVSDRRSPPPPTFNLYLLELAGSRSLDCPVAPFPCPHTAQSKLADRPQVDAGRGSEIGDHFPNSRFAASHNHAVKVGTNGLLRSLM